MKRKLTRLSRSYQTALRKHLKQGPRASLLPARGLGCQAVALDLETLDVALIHDQALAKLEKSSSRDGFIKKAETFFAEAISPIEKTHRAALKANAHLTLLARTLGRCTTDLAASNQSLKRGIVKRKAVERALRKSAGRYALLMTESRQLQNHLRQLTHQLLSTQEKRRTKISRQLHDEIAQTLLGINVRLLALKQEGTVHTRGFKKEVANTQRLVETSVKTMSRFGHEFGKHGT